MTQTHPNGSWVANSEYQEPSHLGLVTWLHNHIIPYLSMHTWHTHTWSYHTRVVTTSYPSIYEVYLANSYQELSYQGSDYILATYLWSIPGIPIPGAIIPGWPPIIPGIPPIPGKENKCYHLLQLFLVKIQKLRRFEKLKKISLMVL